MYTVHSPVRGLGSGRPARFAVLEISAKPRERYGLDWDFIGLFDYSKRHESDSD